MGNGSIGRRSQGFRQGLRLSVAVVAAWLLATTVAQSARQRGRLTGTVVDEGGTPVGGLELVFVPTDGTVRNAQRLEVDGNGTFKHAFFPAGHYKLEVASSEWSVRSMLYVLRDETGLELHRQKGDAHPKEGLAPLWLGPVEGSAGVGVIYRTGTKLELEVVLAKKQAGEQGVQEVGPAGSAQPPKKLLELYQSGKMEGVVSEADALLRDDPQLAAAHYFRGISLIKLERYEEAEASLRQALAASPDPAGIEGALGSALLSRARAKKGTEGEEQARALYNEAAELLGRELSRTPDSVPLLTNYASALEGTGKKRELTDVLERLVVLSPEDAALRLRLASLHVEEGRLDRAMDLLLKGSPEDPGAAAVIHNIAVKLFNDGKMNEAIEVAQKGVGKYPAFPQLYRVLGRGYASVGNRKAAIEALKKLVALAPSDDPEIAGDRELLEFLEKQGG